MVFFHPMFYNTNSDASFGPLFRFLEEFDNHNSQQTARRDAAPQWQPKFDIRETEQAFELHGEFPGVSKESVNINFIDSQTIVIHGKTERSYTSEPSQAAPAEGPAGSDVADESDEISTSSYQATVEDFDDVSGGAAQFSSTKADKGKARDVGNTQPAVNKPAAQSKLWISERSIGEFSRSFEFPARVEPDSATASFDQGILTIVVPKAKKHESRRIAVL